MGNPLKIGNTKFPIVACLLLALLCANMNRAFCFSSLDLLETAGWGNGTTGGSVDYVGGDDDEEFLMESEVSRRILAQDKDHLSYNVLRTGAQCDKKGRYGNCDLLRSSSANPRKCDMENRCGRNNN